ncbi:MAG: zinc ABC transporter substrate-binding protein [Clostridia bacterium]|nr:zinc ABC transporter substrate-binding protein [Clostridia bacterium]
MKQAFRQYGAVAALLAAILALAVGFTLLMGNLTLVPCKCTTTPVLATTYPIYVAAQRVVGQNSDIITVTRLDGAASGCLHDYQMSPSDRKAVQEAHLILMNGAGAETFLHGIVEESKCVDTSAGLDRLCTEHDHDHGEHHHEEEYNEHVWLSPARYIKQVEAVRDALCAIDPEMSHVYFANAADYIIEIIAIRQEMETLAASLKDRPCVLFHDSMAYLAADLGLDVKLTLSVEGESGLSAADLKQVEALATEYPDLLLLYDTQYALRYDGVAGTPVIIRTAVQEDWLTAMRENVENLKNITEGGDAK